MKKHWVVWLFAWMLLLQSATAGVDVNDLHHTMQSETAALSHTATPSTTATADHHTVITTAQHTTDADGCTPDGGVHQHGHCCHGHFSAAIQVLPFPVATATHHTVPRYRFSVTPSPADELLRPPTV